MFEQGTITKGEGSVQLTSSLRKAVLQKKEKNIVSAWKATSLNLKQGGQTSWSFPFSKDSLVRVMTHLVPKTFWNGNLGAATIKLFTPVITTKLVCLSKPATFSLS